jgi:hypothetical protein
MSSLACRLPDGCAVHILPSHGKGHIADITHAKYLSESYAICGTIRVFEPALMSSCCNKGMFSVASLEEKLNGRDLVKDSNITPKALSKKVFNEICLIQWKNKVGNWGKPQNVHGLVKDFYFTPKHPSKNRPPLPLRMSMQVLRRSGRKVDCPPAKIFCPTLKCVASLASKTMPREFSTPSVAEVAIPIFKSELRKWDKKIKESEIMLPWAWHRGERLGYTDEDFAHLLSTPNWPLTVEAVRKLRTRHGFDSTPELLLRNAPEDDVPIAFTRRINEILETLRKPTVIDHALHYLMSTLFFSNDVVFVGLCCYLGI